MGVVTTSFNVLNIRRVLGRDNWAAPRAFGPDGWSFVNFDGKSTVVFTAGDSLDGVEWVHASIAHADNMPAYSDLKLLHRAVYGDGWAHQVFAPPSDHVNIHEHALHLWGLAGVHIVRESELKMYRRSLYPPGDRAWCGQSVTNHTRSPVIDVDPSKPLDEGLHWHWPCVFAHALHLGLSDRIISMVLETEAEGEQIIVSELAAKDVPS